MMGSTISEPIVLIASLTMDGVFDQSRPATHRYGAIQPTIL
jgi:hypothetical protein